MPYFDSAEYRGVWNFSGCTRTLTAYFSFIRLFGSFKGSKKHSFRIIASPDNSWVSLETVPQHWLPSNSFKYSGYRTSMSSGIAFLFAIYLFCFFLAPLILIFNITSSFYTIACSKKSQMSSLVEVVTALQFDKCNLKILETESSKHS